MQELRGPSFSQLVMRSHTSIASIKRTPRTHKMPSILLLSPMQSISDIAPDVASELGIDIAIETTDDARAIQVIKNYPEVEIVVTRGGLADLARQVPGPEITRHPLISH